MPKRRRGVGMIHRGPPLDWSPPRYGLSAALIASGSIITAVSGMERRVTLALGVTVTPTASV